MTQQEAVQRLYNTYSEYGVTKEILDRLFEDGANNYHFTAQETFNLLRMSLAHEHNEREYFSASEIASMLNMTEPEIIAEIKKAKAGNKAVISGLKMYFPHSL